MRTIKFRGKNEKNGEWEHGFFAYLHIPDKIDSGQITIGYQSIPSIFNDGEGYREGSYWKTVVQKTVGQFTGLKDMNGTDIYEGDIVDLDFILYDPWDDGEETLEPMRCVVEYGDFGFFFKKEEDLYYSLNDVENIKVIGNIHDNPELLEGGAL